MIKTVVMCQLKKTVTPKKKKKKKWWSKVCAVSEGQKKPTKN